MVRAIYEKRADPACTGQHRMSRASQPEPNDNRLRALGVRWNASHRHQPFKGSKSLSSIHENATKQAGRSEARRSTESAGCAVKSEPSPGIMQSHEAPTLELQKMPRRRHPNEWFRRATSRHEQIKTKPHWKRSERWTSKLRTFQAQAPSPAEVSFETS